MAQAGRGAVFGWGRRVTAVGSHIADQPRRKKMLFMAIFTYAPEDRDQVIRRRLDSLGKEVGVEVKGEWFDISGHRVFRLFETEDEAHLAASIYNWTDLGVAEIFPVMETQKALKLLQKLSKK
jgi:hypothetical protein